LNDIKTLGRTPAPIAGDVPSSAPEPTSPREELVASALRPFQRSSIRGSLWQLANSLIPYAGLWVLMAHTVEVSYPLTLGLAVLAAGFLVRIFIIFHDCGHGSFFRSRRANEWVGFLTGVLTLTPHHKWWHDHALHHAHAGNLDRRGDGDVWTMTVQEFREASRWKKLGYVLVRQPLFMLTVGPLLVFVVQHRFPSRSSRAKERRSVLLTNLALAVGVVTLGLTIGWLDYLAIHLPILMISGAAGIWLFYVQHQYEETYWRREEECDFFDAALQGSSWYDLPRVLQWFSGNIGFHHVHHLSPRIPNYRLEACHRAFEVLRSVRPLGLRRSLRSAQLRLWDEEQMRLVGWREAWRGGARGSV
jgi:omega-6 fatty acid desaturase (delta-12 desaturase)